MATMRVSRMSDFIVIVSIAPWARRSAWWRNARSALQAGIAERPAVVLMSYFQAAGGNDSGAISSREVEYLRGWAARIPGWKEHALKGQFPLRFNGYGRMASDDTGS